MYAPKKADSDPFMEQAEGIYVLEVLLGGYDLSNFLCSVVDINATREHANDLHQETMYHYGVGIQGDSQETSICLERKAMIEYYEKGKNHLPKSYSFDPEPNGIEDTGMR